MKRLARIVTGMLVGLLLSSCSTPYKEAVVVAADGKPEFPGIYQLLGSKPDVDVLMVHGMCTHDEAWVRESISALAAQLGDHSTPAIRPQPVPGTKVTIFRADIAASAGQAHVAALLWSPITAELKSSLCYDQSDKSALCLRQPRASAPYPYKRASLNQGLKDGLLDDCLADALIYQGKSREAISEQVQAAIALALSGGTAGGARPLVVMTDSLGSKVAFDALFRLTVSPTDGPRAAAARAVERIEMVFMRANQLPILALADRSISPNTALAIDRFPADPIGAVLSLKKRAFVAAPSNRVVAFTDPNDLLSYILTPTSFAKNGQYALVDVIVSNQPTYFGLVERPDLAHTSYSTNPAVVRLIACGLPQAPGCGVH